MNIWAKVGIILLNIVFIATIVVCSVIIDNKCDKREAECTIWSDNGGDNCKIRYNVPNYTTVCDYDSKCNSDKNITIDCYFDNEDKLDIECPVTKCIGQGEGAQVGATLGLTFSLVFEIFALIPLFHMCYNRCPGC